MIAVDTNILVYLWFPSDQTGVSEKIYNCDPVWIAPFLWRSEFRNIVAKSLQRGVSFEIAIESIKQAENLMRSREYQVNSGQILELVKASGCTAYECEFLCVARDKKVPLVTFNSRLFERFPDIAVHPLDFIGKM